MRLLPLIVILLVGSNAFAENAQLIANVIQRGNFLYVYNTNGRQLCTINAGDGLAGYTGSSVSVKRGNFIYVFDARGKQTSIVAAGE